MELFAGIWRDILYGFRWLRRNPGFAAVAVLTMAVGISANTCVFSIIESTLLFPLPYPHPDRIVSAGSQKEFTFESWEEHSQTFAAVSGQTADQMTLVGQGSAERLDIAKVTSGFFTVLGVKPALGRAFLRSETRAGSPTTASHVVILSYGLWRDRFGSNPKLIGEAIHLDDKLYTIVGVLPEHFEFPSQHRREPALLLPLNLTGSLVTGPNGDVSWSGVTVSVLGRLKPGITMPEAQAELRTIAQVRVAGFGTGMRVVSLREFLVGNTESTLLIFWGTVGFVLLIACVNLTNLMLGHALAREKEVAVRVALGANRGRVARQLLAESLLVAALGAFAGIAIAYALVVLVRTLGPDDIPRLREARISLPVLGFTALVTALSGILAGLAPIRSAWRVPTIEALKDGPRTSVGRRHRRLQGALAIAEIAIALILVVGASLLMRSFLSLTGVPRHFDPHNLLVAEIAPPQAKYANAVRLWQFEDLLLAGIERLPEVRAVAAGDRSPMMGGGGGGSMWVGRGANNGQPTMAFAGINTVSRGFFRAVGMPVLEGREFQPTDTATSEPVIIVNDSFSHHFFPGGDALGKQIGRITSVKDWKGEATIVGVVADEEEDESSPIVYLDYAQHPSPFLTVLIRTRGYPDAIVPVLRDQVKQLDSDLPVFGVQTMDELLGEQVAKPKFNTMVLGGFAVIALLLATMGVYGVISYSVGQRTHEIGIRTALGAEESAVMRMVLGETLIIALAGIVIGLAGAAALTRYLQSMLYRVHPDDPFSFGLAAAVLLTAALLAALIPARRAMKIEPIIALRYE